MGRKFLALIPIAIPVPIYLAGSFACASFDISDWPMSGRAFCAFLMLLLFAGGCGVALTMAEEQRP